MIATSGRIGAAFVLGRLLSVASLQVLATDPEQVAPAFRLGFTEPMYNGSWLALHLVLIFILYLAAQTIRFLFGLTSGKRDRAMGG